MAIPAEVLYDYFSARAKKIGIQTRPTLNTFRNNLRDLGFETKKYSIQKKQRNYYILSPLAIANAFVAKGTNVEVGQSGLKLYVESGKATADKRFKGCQFIPESDKTGQGGQ